LSPRLKEVIAEIVQRASTRKFDAYGQLLFAVAARGSDLESGLTRFMLYEGIRINLIVGTWRQPEAEGYGWLNAVERQAQATLEARLKQGAMFDDNIDPLHVLVAESFQLLEAEAVRALRILRGDSALLLAEFAELTDAIRVARELYARDAAVVHPGSFAERLGSQRIADRYPWHFGSANAVDKARSDLRRRLRAVDWEVKADGDRFIDVFLAAAEAAR
jgi:hypothetical protein